MDSTTNPAEASWMQYYVAIRNGDINNVTWYLDNHYDPRLKLNKSFDSLDIAIIYSARLDMVQLVLKYYIKCLRKNYYCKPEQFDEKRRTTLKQKLLIAQKFQQADIVAYLCTLLNCDINEYPLITAVTHSPLEHFIEIGDLDTFKSRLNDFCEESDPDSFLYHPLEPDSSGPYGEMYYDIPSRETELILAFTTALFVQNTEFIKCIIHEHRILFNWCVVNFAPSVHSRNICFQYSSVDILKQLLNHSELPNYSTTLRLFFLRGIVNTALSIDDVDLVQCILDQFPKYGFHITCENSHLTDNVHIYLLVVNNQHRFAIKCRSTSTNVNDYRHDEIDPNEFDPEEFDYIGVDQNYHGIFDDVLRFGCVPVSLPLFELIVKHCHAHCAFHNRNPFEELFDLEPVIYMGVHGIVTGEYIEYDVTREMELEFDEEMMKFVLLQQEWSVNIAYYRALLRVLSHYSPFPSVNRMRSLLHNLVRSFSLVTPHTVYCTSLIVAFCDWFNPRLVLTQAAMRDCVQAICLRVTYDKSPILRYDDVQCIKDTIACLTGSLNNILYVFHQILIRIRIDETFASQMPNRENLVLYAFAISRFLTTSGIALKASPNDIPENYPTELRDMTSFNAFRKLPLLYHCRLKILKTIRKNSHSNCDASRSHPSRIRSVSDTIRSLGDLLPKSLIDFLLFESENK